MDVNLITFLSLPPDSVLITSNALPLARLRSWGCLTEMFLQESDSAVPVALAVSMGMCMNPCTVKCVTKLCIAENCIIPVCEHSNGEFKYTCNGAFLLTLRQY